MKKLLIIVGILVVALVLAVVGYGFYNGSRVKSYAKDVKSIMEESNSKWTQQKMEAGNYTTDEMREKVQLIKADCEKQLGKLNGLKAPGKAKGLESKAKEYFTIAKDVSGRMLAFLDYAKVLEDSGKELRSLGGEANGIEEFIRMFTDMHNKLSASLTKLRGANPPASFKEFHEKYVAALDRMDKAIVKAIEYARKNQMDQLGTLTSEFETAMKEIDKTDMPNQSSATAEILTQDKKDKLKNYSAEIKTEADKLMKTVFSF